MSRLRESCRRICVRLRRRCGIEPKTAQFSSLHRFWFTPMTKKFVTTTTLLSVTASLFLPSSLLYPLYADAAYARAADTPAITATSPAAAPSDTAKTAEKDLKNPAQKTEKDDAKNAQKEPTRVLVLDLKSNGVDEAAVRTLNSLVAVAAAEIPIFDVVSGADVQQMIALEAERQQLGCDAQGASCLAELAGAIGAQVVLFGDVGKLGDLYVINLNLFDSIQLKSIGRATLNARDLGDLPPLLHDKIAILARPLLLAAGSPDGGGQQNNNNQNGNGKNNGKNDGKNDGKNGGGGNGGNGQQNPQPIPDAGESAWILPTTGAGIAVTGLVLSAVGGGSFLTYQSKQQELATLENQFRATSNPQEAQSLVSQSSVVRTDALAALDSWNQSGVYLFFGGLAGVVIGAGVAAAPYFLLTPTENQ